MDDPAKHLDKLNLGGDSATVRIAAPQGGSKTFSGKDGGKIRHQMF